jgi:type II secretory pathway pseudopilin PulG
MVKSKQKDDLRKYRKFGLTLLQLMAVLAIVGFLLTALFNYLF